MTNKITATYAGSGNHDNGNEAGGYGIYKFTDIVDSDNNKFGDKWTKQTKLLQEVNLKGGLRYEMELSEPIEDKYGNMAFPIRIKEENSLISYLKKGGSIFSEDENGNQINLSVSQSFKHMLRRKLP
jgi:hypothetical protein